MEEILNTMRATQAKKDAMAKSRAMEMQMKAPQLIDSNLLQPTTDGVIHGKGVGGGEAGLKRVIGRGRPKKVVGESNGVMEGGSKNAKDMGAKIAKQLKSLHGKEFAEDFHQGIMDELSGGMMLGMPGHGVMKGRGKKMAGCGGPISAPPSGLEVSHAFMSPVQEGQPGSATGGQDVPPGGLVPFAYGNVPQAPSSFKRNTVGMGKPAGAGRPVGAAMCGSGMCGSGMCGGAMDSEQMTKKLSQVVARKKGGAMCDGAMCGGVVSKKGREDEKLGMEVSMLKKKMKGGVSCKGCASCKGVDECRGAGKKTSERGQMIAKLMKGSGMTLGQASKYLKENPQ